MDPAEINNVGGGVEASIIVGPAVEGADDEDVDGTVGATVVEDGSVVTLPPVVGVVVGVETDMLLGASVGYGAKLPSLESRIVQFPPSGSKVNRFPVPT